MSKKQKDSKKGGGRKKGRNKAKCARYKDFKVRERNKERKVEKHLKKHPNDLNARNSV